MPTADEITEEGFGYFRGTWLIGYVPLDEARTVVGKEGEILSRLDQLASNPEEFEQLASAIEQQDVSKIPEPLRGAALSMGLGEFVDDHDPYSAPLVGLEVGVAGLANALSSVRCLTAASCRWHAAAASWSDCPVVFFAGVAWRVEILAELIGSEGCGLSAGRDMLSVHASSVRDTHRLAERILAERARFRRKPDHRRGAPPPPRGQQMNLL